jgi:predicted AAA+ superfamily ATPase
MHNILRNKLQLVEKRLKTNPVVALLGPRQCGKSTIAKEFLKDIKDSVFLDLENNKDLSKLNDIWAFFDLHKGKLICLDEIQLVPEIFSQIRSYVDQEDMNGKFLILGSASRELIKQSSETLAGRISYIEMTPFRYSELLNEKDRKGSYIRGSFPRSFLAIDAESSFDWRENFIKTFLERDIPSLGFRIPSQVLNRFWTMLAHSQGQLVNKSKLASSLGVSSNTIKHYIYILEETFMVRSLKPYSENIKKRMVKSPKIYIRDSGIVHTLLGIDTANDLLGHPISGLSYEGYIIENIIDLYPKHEPYFFKTAKGDEIDLVLVKGSEKIAFEIKSSTSPKLEQGFWKSKEILMPTESYIIANVDEAYPYKNGVWVYNLEEFTKKRLNIDNN